MPPEDPSKLPDEPPDKSPLQTGQKSLPTDGETRSDELGPPPPDKSPAGSPDKSPVLPPKRGRPTDEKTRDDIIASYRERPNLSRIERAKIFGLSPEAMRKRVRRIEAEGGIQHLKHATVRAALNLVGRPSRSGRNRVSCGSIPQAHAQTKRVRLDTRKGAMNPEGSVDLSPGKALDRFNPFLGMSNLENWILDTRIGFHRYY